ncbi:hypothetical protein K7432_017268 [Basidiobolus ranarum]|uniref:Uncharacterized protein n=1 Tax=Basidiobolus ranarum TaxID=34480 RepID=A0ABR2WDM1_9FUNG
MKLSVATLLVTAFALVTLTIEANPVPAEEVSPSSSDTVKPLACCIEYCSDSWRCCQWSACMP